MNRIVKMSFRPDTIDLFLQLFEEKKPFIRNFPGCQHLELWKDVNDPLRYFTFSTWDNEESLLNYRQSEFFVETWASTRKLFAGKPEAWSVTPQPPSISGRE